MTGEEKLKRAAAGDLQKVLKRIEDMVGFAAPEAWPAHLERIKEDIEDAIDGLIGESVEE